MQFIRPPALLKGDLVGVCTPSLPAHTMFRAKYLHGIEELKRLGFRVVEGDLTARATAQGARSKVRSQTRPCAHGSSAS